MYRIFYWFGKKIVLYQAIGKEDRDSFLRSLGRSGVLVLAVVEVECM